MTTKKAILKNIKDRLSEEVSSRSSIAWLKEIAPEVYIDDLISIVYLYTRPKKGLNKASIFMAEVVSAIGHSIRSRLKLRRDSALSARTGAFLLYTFEHYKMLQVALGGGANGHNQYIVQVLNDEAIVSLWSQVDPTAEEKLPSETPYQDWTSARHATGALLVKTSNRGVLDSLTPETHPIVFENINRPQRVGWRINKAVYDLHLWALRNKAAAFSEIWDQASAEARTTKLREAKAIGDIAKRFIGKTFYHLYYYDFRGRKYPTTAYLHEQGSDLARGMLLRNDSAPIGKAGFFWLLVSIASNWAGDAGREDGRKTDKIPLADRFQWVLDNEEIILSYADSPKVHQGWMKADKPWQFLAACKELHRLRLWQVEEGDFDNYELESSLEVFIDGSNNGSQHLAALTRDEITAPHVNLVPQELPGDLYKYVADHVWENIDKAVATNYSQEEIEACNKYIDTILDMKRQIAQAEPKSEIRQAAVEQLKAYRFSNDLLAKITAPVFWKRITDNKHRRKVVKRNVMTLPL